MYLLNETKFLTLCSELAHWGVPSSKGGRVGMFSDGNPKFHFSLTSVYGRLIQIANNGGGVALIHSYT